MANDNVSILEIPGKGGRFAVMPEADFLVMEKTLKHLGIALRNKDAAEDMREIVEASLARGRIERGEEETYPSALVSKLVAGENPVRAFRIWRGLSAGELARNSGISAPYLSEIETGGKTGSVSALKRIAAVLAIDLEDIVG
jgi:DNA-binding Xre family transcriptional regulator